MWKLFIDDDRYPIDKSWVLSRNYDDTLWYIRTNGLPTVISFDHDLGHPNNRTGMDIAKWLVNHIMDNNLPLPDGFTVIVHSQNPVGAANIKGLMDGFLKDYA